MKTEKYQNLTDLVVNFKIYIIFLALFEVKTAVSGTMNPMFIFYYSLE